ncbi:MAG: T9SS type A sorting domain-containing protein [Paludibacter sp.]
MEKKNYSLIRTGFLSLLVLVFTMSSIPLKAADITTGLVAHYSFDAVSGTTATDDTGNSNSGTLMGAPTVNTSGYSGSAMNFPTATDYMTLPAGIVSTLTDFSISSWVHINTLNTWSRIFDFGTGTSYYMFLSPRATSATGPVRFAFKNGGAEQVISGTTALPTGKWVHVAVTLAWEAAASKGIGKLYVNGSLVGTNAAMTINPSLLPATTQNYIAKSQWPDPSLAGSVDEFRLYNRALANVDVLTLAGTPLTLVDAYSNLTAGSLKTGGDLANITSSLTLPVTSGPDVAIAWTSSLPATVATDGTVILPDKYNATVTLTATLTQIMNGTTYTLTKKFTVTVKARNVAAEQLAQWNFGTNNIFVRNDSIKVTDTTESGFVGSLQNEARIRTIGGPANGKINVLDLGNGTGYFDMGTEIGKAVYSLNNYTMCAFFRIDDTYTALNTNGNFMWNFSNSANAPVDMNGYVIGSLKNQSLNCSSSYWAMGDQGVGLNSNAPKGGWHHMAFTQNGTTGTIYIDGVMVAQNTGMTNVPATALPRAGFSGTLYNWLGRSCYPGDVYLRQTLLYDFQLLGVPLTSDDLYSYISVTDSINKLNNAYAENPDLILPELATESTNLSLGDLSALTSNIILPSKGTLDNSITITWKSANNSLISNAGVVTRPNYYNANDTLIATLTKNGQKVTKPFPATVLAATGSAFTSDLLVKYDFSNVNMADSTVTDAAEKHFKGTLKNKATIKTIGITNQYNVLNLGDSLNAKGYFDLGQEIGQLLYHQNDYTMSAYFRINEAYTGLASNGNFIWNFSNTANAMTDQNGYLIGSLKDQSVSITPKFYTAASGNQSISMGATALPGGWHNITYTQTGSVGNLYIDGFMIMSAAITTTPATALSKPDKLGTIYNWIGRSCYASDAYLRQTLIADFRLYGRALTDEEISTTILNAPEKVSMLNVAYQESLSGLIPIQSTPYTVLTEKGRLKINGLSGSESVAVFDMTGRKLNTKNQSTISLNAGIYILRINNTTTKVIVH